ncbi:MAG: GGDEF domain-containing protein [Leptolyngbyaceae cyanobacterium T60_A2020_046]|nr:GGDEF domain-containing protein [Leptolyngbyaceae cyanobacterium T60_A2020_046]
MNASVLIVGEADFSRRLFQQVRGLAAMTTWHAQTAHDAEPLLETHLPEFLVLQATQPDNWELCHAVKQQRHLMWMYCLMLDDRRCPNLTTPADALQRQHHLTTTALEAGADAYLWMPNLMETEDADNADPTDTDLSRLLQAYFRAGMRRIQAHQELSKQNDLLSAIALSDALTQLGNRRAFDWELPRQVQYAREHHQPLSLLILDIDFFKAVNDEHGHLAGDQVLRLFSERLRRNMRFYETPFRYGGEEFVVLLQNIPLDEAEQIGERLRRLIDDTPFVIHETLDLALTVSIGVSTLEVEDDDQGRDLVRRADANLMQAKLAGRNRVVVG